MADRDPKIEARPNSQFGNDWCVYVAWASGKTDVVTGFENQYRALNWIKNESANWVADQIMRGPI